MKNFEVIMHTRSNYWRGMQTNSAIIELVWELVISSMQYKFEQHTYTTFEVKVKLLT